MIYLERRQVEELTREYTNLRLYIFGLDPAVVPLETFLQELPKFVPKEDSIRIKESIKEIEEIYKCKPEAVYLALSPKVPNFHDNREDVRLTVSVLRVFVLFSAERLFPEYYFLYALPECIPVASLKLVEEFRNYYYFISNRSSSKCPGTEKLKPLLQAYTGLNHSILDAHRRRIFSDNNVVPSFVLQRAAEDNLPGLSPAVSLYLWGHTQRTLGNRRTLDYLRLPVTEVFNAGSILVDTAGNRYREPPPSMDSCLVGNLGDRRSEAYAAGWGMPVDGGAPPHFGTSLTSIRFSNYIGLDVIALRFNLIAFNHNLMLIKNTLYRFRDNNRLDVIARTRLRGEVDNAKSLESFPIEGASYIKSHEAAMILGLMADASPESRDWIAGVLPSAWLRYLENEYRWSRIDLEF